MRHCRALAEPVTPVAEVTILRLVTHSVVSDERSRRWERTTTSRRSRGSTRPSGGDVDAVLAGVTDDVDWATETSSTVAPWYGVRHGKEGVASFFQAFGSTMEVQEFNPYAFAANDTEVHCIVEPRRELLARRSTTISTTTSVSRMERLPSIGARRTPPRPKPR